jgi:hypothetical protein
MGFTEEIEKQSRIEVPDLANLKHRIHSNNWWY